MLFFLGPASVEESPWPYNPLNQQSYPKAIVTRVILAPSYHYYHVSYDVDFFFCPYFSRSAGRGRGISAMRPLHTCL